MAQKVINNAENHLVVGSLEVIGDVTGQGMQTIRRSIEAVNTSVQQYQQKQENYWNEISDDGLIIPLEKQILYKEWQAIVQTYTAIIKQANEKDLINRQEIVEYKQAYDSLYAYLYKDLKIFDDMSKNTELADRDEFNSKYSTYYAKENYTQLALAIGSIGSTYRVLKNLQEIGLEDELAIYNAEIYQWKDNRWVKVGTNGYVGVQRSLPAEISGNYFLAGDDFNSYVELISPEGDEYISPEGNTYLILVEFYKGRIYEFNGSKWRMVQDSDYRYLVVMTDYFELTGTFPPAWKDFIATQLDDAVDKMTEEMREALAALKKELQGEIDDIQVSKYLGPYETDPPDAKKGDWYCYNGTNTATRTKGYMYRYEGGSTWTKINPEDPGNSQFYMAGLDDVLSASDTQDVGHFNIIFARALFANTGVMNQLGVHQIVIQEGGSIISKDYVAESSRRGFALDGDTGKLSCVDGEFTGKIITADGSQIKGTCIVDKLHFNRTYKDYEIADFSNGDIWMM